MKRQSNSKLDHSPSQKQKLELEGDWTELPKLLVYRTHGAKIYPKLAAFDMDGTLIAIKSGHRFPTGPDDWMLWSQTIPPKLRALSSGNSAFSIVLITNQAAIERAPKGGKAGFKRKIENVVKALGVPAIVMVAVDPDSCCLYRKPCTGGLDFLADLGKKEVGSSDTKGSFFDLKSSFYCGDAAGRIEGWKKGAKKDWASTDRLFAINAGLPFYTPEELFLKQSPAPFTLPSFDPKKVNCGGSPVDDASKIVVSNKELVIYVGPPACGKTSFSKRHFLPTSNYDVWSRDVLGTWQKVAQAARKSLISGRSVVIDNTNPDVESRSRYIDIAKDLKVATRCFLFDVSIDQARHNEKFRRLAWFIRNEKKVTEKPHSKVPEVAFNTYKSKFKEPTTQEGFSDIVRIKFVAEFKDPEMEKLYKSYLVEK